MPERQRVDDPYRDIVGQPEGTPTNKAIELAPGAVPFTDPTVQTVNLTYTVASKGATADLSSTAAVTVPDDGVTVTSVTYTPAGTQAAPTAGNSRTYTLTGAEGTIATYVFDSTKTAGFVSSTPVSFTLSNTALKQNETLNLASTHAGSGVADPGGVLTVTYTL